MANPIESTQSTPLQREEARPSRSLKLGVIAAASLFVGGLAAAFWYRKTLTTLRQVDNDFTKPQYVNSGNDESDEA